jgi:hypothetical protein
VPYQIARIKEVLFINPKYMENLILSIIIKKLSYSLMDVSGINIQSISQNPIQTKNSGKIKSIKM